MKTSFCRLRTISADEESTRFSTAICNLELYEMKLNNPPRMEEAS